ncbi:hypothetical protein B0J15DRAFT_553263 [Fusarium solani]|uniref:Uracil catabolism protein 4 n=1 Tax=Fusarium solani TaxID=169388 RepID=A0A9P9GJP9_FUSSL|nr:uncharacterized protein B0J15DRAFT_553263 [Fusarium solani]KAH7240391.1 hypothetical protein B0J15DRAFT_553263 [Fusarium solani]
MTSAAVDPAIQHLLSLQAVRERSQLVFRAAQEGSLRSFQYDAQRMPHVADFVIGVIKRDFGPDRFIEIPPHGRWQHLEVGGVPRLAQCLDTWTSQGCDKLELTRRLVDLFFVSVLLDAGAGDVWKFKEPGTNQVYNRSEGIGVASLYMFKSGVFSNDGTDCVVDGKGLVDLSEKAFEEYFQISVENPLIGVSSRIELMRSVGRSLLAQPDMAGSTGRPGNIVDYLIKASKAPHTLDYELLWSTLQRILLPAWPKNRTTVAGTSLGDAWPLRALSDRSKETGLGADIAAIQPFHKLTQWLGYSLTVPFTRVLGFKISNLHLGTGLPEYRNGGLFVDLGVLTLKPEALREGRKLSGQELPMFNATSDTIVEWRAMTVALLDELHKLVALEFEKSGSALNMAQMLEAGTWKGGREIASKLRPATKSSPILIDGDGTLF